MGCSPFGCERTPGEEPRPLVGRRCAFHRLLQAAHVAVVPGGVFGAEQHLRISYVTSHVRLVEAADRIADAVAAI